MGKKLSEAEEARHTQMADWAESDAGLIPEDAVFIAGEGPGARLAYLEHLLGSSKAVDEHGDGAGLDG